MCVRNRRTAHRQAKPVTQGREAEAFGLGVRPLAETDRAVFLLDDSGDLQAAATNPSACGNDTGVVAHGQESCRVSRIPQDAGPGAYCYSEKKESKWFFAFVEKSLPRPAEPSSFLLQIPTKIFWSLSAASLA